MRKLLLPFSLLYGIIVFIRNHLYNYDHIKAKRLNSFVISVGNISTGGTGKTPFVEFLAEILLNKNKSVVIVSKGYKRTYDDIQVAETGYSNKDNRLTSENFGDEGLQMMFNLPDKDGKGLLVVSDDKLQGAKFADKKFKPDVIIIDDAFQHRKVFRDLDIVIINLENPSFLLPAGNGREYFRSIKRSNLVVLNKKFEPVSFSKYEAKLPNLIVTEYNNSGFYNDQGNKAEPGKDFIVAFCGIGDPDSFKELLRLSNFKIAQFYQFPDHHDFSASELNDIIGMFKTTGSKYIITSQKDFMRLKYSKNTLKGDKTFNDIISNYPLYYPKIKMQISKNADKLYEKLSKIVQI